MKEITVKVHEIAVDGLPPTDEDGDMRDDLIGRIAFIWDGNIVNGLPIGEESESEDEWVPWEADLDIGRPGPYYNVTHWIEFPVRLRSMEE